MPPKLNAESFVDAIEKKMYIIVQLINFSSTQGF